MAAQIILVKNRAEVFSAVKDILTETLCVDEEKVIEEVNIWKDLDGTEIYLLQIAFRLERTFAIEVPMQKLHLKFEDLKKITVKDLVDFVCGKLNITA